MPTLHMMQSLMPTVHFPDNRADGWEPLLVDRPDGSATDVAPATKGSIKVWTPEDLAVEDELDHPPPTITYKGMVGVEKCVRGQAH